jgi:hypothetical protein
MTRVNGASIEGQRKTFEKLSISAAAEHERRMIGERTKIKASTVHKVRTQRGAVVAAGAD